MGRSGESVPYQYRTGTVPVRYGTCSLFGLWVSIDQDTKLQIQYLRMDVPVHN